MRLCSFSGRDFQNFSGWKFTVFRLEYDHFRVGISLFSDWNTTFFLCDYVQFRVGIFRIFRVGISLFSDWNMTFFLCDYVQFQVGIFRIFGVGILLFLDQYESIGQFFYKYYGQFSIRFFTIYKNVNIW